MAWSFDQDDGVGGQAEDCSLSGTTVEGGYEAKDKHWSVPTACIYNINSKYDPCSALDEYS